MSSSQEGQMCNSEMPRKLVGIVDPGEICYRSQGNCHSLSKLSEGLGSLDYGENCSVLKRYQEEHYILRVVLQLYLQVGEGGSADHN